MKKVPTDTLVNFRLLTKKLANKGVVQDINLEIEIHKKLLSFFQVGDYYYYVYNLKNGEFDFVNEGTEKVLGCKPQDLTVASLISAIHPDDVSWFLNFENKVTEFFSGLRADQVLKYKVRYDYRLKKKDGYYIRILQQVITLQYDEPSRSLLRTFGIHTDITHLKKEGRPVLSFIGLEGEPSYIDVDVKKVFATSLPVISEREKEVLILLIDGKPSKTIAQHLFISPETVNKHRQNMLRKTNTASTAELVAMAVKNGWV